MTHFRKDQHTNITLTDQKLSKIIFTGFIAPISNADRVNKFSALSLFDVLEAWKYMVPLIGNVLKTRGLLSLLCSMGWHIRTSITVGSWESSRLVQLRLKCGSARKHRLRSPLQNELTFNISMTFTIFVRQYVHVDLYSWNLLFDNLL